MATVVSTNAKIASFIRDTELTHQIVHGTDTTTVVTDGGPVDSLAKTMKELGEQSVIVSEDFLNGLESAVNATADATLAAMDVRINDEADVVLAALNTSVNVAADGILAGAEAARDSVIDILPHFTATPPVTPIAGQMWTDNATGRKYEWVVDVDSSQWVETGAVVSVGIAVEVGATGAAQQALESAAAALASEVAAAATLAGAVKTVDLAAPGGAGMVATSSGDTAQTFIDRASSRFGRVSVASLPRFFDKWRAYRHDLQAPLKIVGFGSSVGVGATLPDAATQAPVKFFTGVFKAKVDPGSLFNIVSSNQSVNGSTVNDFPAAWAASLAAGDIPDLAFFAYGMNDGAVATYNNGQTFPGFYTAFRNAILTAKAAGADVVICTTPHPAVVTYAGSLYFMPPGIAQIYPTEVAATPTPEQLQPPASLSNVTADFLGNGVPITLAHRHLRVNQAMRDLASEFGCVLLDVERYWAEAIQKYQISTGSATDAESTLFNASEVVHPNLLGHQLSYHKAATDFAHALSGQALQAAQEPRLNGRQAVNLPLDVVAGAAFDMYAPYGEVTVKPMSVKVQIGAPDGNGVGAQVEVAYVDPANGNFVTPSVELGGNADPNQALRIPGFSIKNYNGEKATTDIHAHYNVAAAGASAYTLPDNKAGRLRIRAIQGGVALCQVYENMWSTHGGVLTLGESAAEGLFQIGAGTEFTVTASGLVVTVTATYSNTSFYFRCEAW